MREAVRRGWCPIDCLWENTEFKNVEYINGCDANIEKVMRAITRMNEASTVCLPQVKTVDRPFMTRRFRKCLRHLIYAGGGREGGGARGGIFGVGGWPM